VSRRARHALGLRQGTGQQAEGPPLLRALRDNGLSLAFWALFAATLAGTLVAGFALQHEHHAGTRPAASLLAYALSPDLLRSILVNWQAAVLQLLVLVLLARVLRQRGAAHSRRPDGHESPEENAREHRRSWLYRHSLSLALAGLFLVSLTGFILADWPAYNDERARLGERAFDLAHYLGSARLWSNLFQTWEAEFVAMAVFLLLGIVLREEDSAESKPVGAADAQTGGVNE
jgi:hypothetical protein